MKLQRRQCLKLVASAAALPILSPVARAETYPTRPVRIVVGFAAGGGVDVVARLMGQWLSARLGQPFTIENRPGANTNIGTEVVVHAAPDGYTLLLVNAANTISSTIYEKLNFNFIRDIAPVGAIMRVPLTVVVSPSSPAKTLPDFVEYVNANPGKVNMASAGNGAPEHMSGELFNMMAGVKMLHVPYRGAAPALTDLLGGQVQVMFASMPAAIEYVRAGRLRALAVTSAARSEALPEVPSVTEFVPGYEASQWYGLGAPHDISREIIETLNREINGGLADQRLRKQLTDLGGMILGGSAPDLGKLIADDTEKWRKVAKFAGIKVE